VTAQLTGARKPPSLKRSLRILGYRPGKPETVPFSLSDTTVGTETELQAAVQGSRQSVDLPQTIENSSYFANVIRRAAAGDTSPRVIARLEHYLDSNREQVWENSWVRLPYRSLSQSARELFNSDLRAEKPEGGTVCRKDASRFILAQAGEKYLRIPISYLVRLALSDALSFPQLSSPQLQRTGLRILRRFFNDNTSPETSSLHIIRFEPEKGNGREVAKETALRYLLTQLLVQYANEKFELRKNGQHALVFLSPHPPVRQKTLNNCISDSFYRELFMSPCLGWEDGEAKHDYMSLCHQALSRSHLTAVGKLREAGIITSNLVVMPNTSNISLANNGIHISIGSQRLTSLLADPASGFRKSDEKLVGDLVIKIVEHFLPLFVGSYSAAPYRLDFSDFHPERVLGFLPHELDYTHLRMVWRRWKRKARNKLLQRSWTPFGPEWLDGALSRVFRLRGDFVPDYRLLDYPVALLSTRSSPALDGMASNTRRLRQDLDKLGVIDGRMSLYMLYKLRESAVSGFTGFEARHYSLIEGFKQDMAPATDLQVLITALAFQYICSAKYGHESIPDSPSVESERRQIFFGTAIGLPTFFVHQETPNQMMKDLVSRTNNTRQSRRYPGYLRVRIHDFRKALLQVLREDGRELIEMLGLEEAVADLQLRLDNPSQYQAAERITQQIIELAGARSPFALSGTEFNQAAEFFYRKKLRYSHLEEGLDDLIEEIHRLLARTRNVEPELSSAFSLALPQTGQSEFLQTLKQSILTDRPSLNEIVTALQLVLLVEYCAYDRTQESLEQVS
jgi:hypothetical protein